LLPLANLAREQAWLLAVLALIAGYVDAYTFLNYHVYGSFMSGNTTQAGLNAGQGDLAGAAYNFLPIPVFVAGVFAGTFLVYACLANRLRLLFALVAALLMLGIAALALTPLVPWLGIVALSLAMGIMNTSVTSVGPQKVNLGYVSGTLNSLARHLALAAKGMPLLGAADQRDTHARRAALLGAIWTAFVLGALLAGAATPRYSQWSLFFPVFTLLGLAACNPSLEPGSAGAGQGETPGVAGAAHTQGD
jgi:uncharacterized membrane protein YoaK (UPF0700 family)